MQLQMFPRKVVVDLGPVGDGVTAPRSIRADDGFNYVVKDELPSQAAQPPSSLTVRASEFIWLSLARAIGLPAPHPEVIETLSGRLVVGTRKENGLAARDQVGNTIAMLSGRLNMGGEMLSRIYAFDLFCCNWDRHPGNYLMIDDAGVLVVSSIEYSHVAVHPGLATVDPAASPANATRMWFPKVVAPYGADRDAAIDTADRVARLPLSAVQGALTGLPDDWLSTASRDGVLHGGETMQFWDRAREEA